MPFSMRSWRCALLSAAIALCAPMSSAQTPFVEEAAARGVELTTVLALYWGSGMAMNDLDGDGDLDLVITGLWSGRIALMENDGSGYFTDRSEQSGAPTNLSYSGVAAADYDADGDLDLYISAHRSRDLLLRNEGGFRFTDVTDAAGLGGDEGPTVGCSWGDYDGDGWLDLHVTHRSPDSPANEPNRLYRNQRDGTFVETGAQQGIDDTFPSYQSILYDYDRDGDVDLYLSNDKGYTWPGVSNRLWRNDRGNFTEVSVESRANVAIYSMGVAIGDFDSNGFGDIYITNGPQGNPLLLNNGNGTFTERAASAGVLANETGWGTFFFDYDNDGSLDLYVNNLYAPNMLFVQSGGLWPSTDVAPAVGVDNAGPSWCTCAGDIDGDGDLDIILQNSGEPLRLFVNYEGSQRNWLKVRLRGSRPNTFGVGATVELTSGGATQTQSALAGVGFKTSFPQTMHFGLGNATRADRITVHWPGGGRSVLTNVAANSTVQISPPRATADRRTDVVRDGERRR